MRWGLLLLACLLALQPVAGAVAEERLPKETLMTFYDGCVFVGDSITNQMQGYVRRMRETQPDYMQGTKFLVAGSYLLRTASLDYLNDAAANLMYRGREMPLCYILADIKPRRAVILLGVNDYAGAKIEKSIGWCEQIIDLIALHAPDTQVIFESLTPVTRNYCQFQDYRTMWDEYNAALREMCQKRGVGYIDIASGMKDEEGYLPRKYSSDNQYHLDGGAFALWEAALADYAQAQYDAGLWTPGE